MTSEITLFVNPAADAARTFVGLLEARGITVSGEPEPAKAAAGATTLADAISARFRAVCEKSGFAENFDALTGQGLRDRAYTWTASAYLLLAADAGTSRLGNAHEQFRGQPE